MSYFRRRSLSIAIPAWRQRRLEWQATGPAPRTCLPAWPRSSACAGIARPPTGPPCPSSSSCSWPSLTPSRSRASTLPSSQPTCPRAVSTHSPSSRLSRTTIWSEIRRRRWRRTAPLRLRRTCSRCWTLASSWTCSSRWARSRSSSRRTRLSLLRGAFCSPASCKPAPAQCPSWSCPRCHLPSSPGSSDTSTPGTWRLTKRTCWTSCYMPRHCNCARQWTAASSSSR
mmetsp:Transcript_7192/g.30636  ORF Transcript_7192/g.30636 Transcript_7192/m.30636 type:complete len:227 (+) Transcript_7192:2023-2703(+)